MLNSFETWRFHIYRSLLLNLYLQRAVTSNTNQCLRPIQDIVAAWCIKPTSNNQYPREIVLVLHVNISVLFFLLQKYNDNKNNQRTSFGVNAEIDYIQMCSGRKTAMKLFFRKNCHRMMPLSIRMRTASTVAKHTDAV